ncbi:cytoplasmic tRNA 2-thiolation protein 2 [Wyeomyia smithii]|uniref:cytoplasmic tRNA 2-thiolation protein 2 n=1 Tax=Wyeomyia smithii TaxID=174621 RepID=UPI002467D186|nr:cytoplasmic tRNA 2-thiolation protein 2 [Wyeomyia smithii]XP_055538792.1 cytoplasmic tRNA 2-thiolation protein 2 [Wyeomyia smithii]
MCSIGEEDFGDEGAPHLMREDSPMTSTLAEGEMCRKCQQKPAVLKLMIKEPQCQNCFLHYVRHKFRASLGSTKIVRRGSKILVVFDGSPENVTMLDMIQHGIEQESFKKLRIDPVLLLVSEDFLFGNKDAWVKKTEEKINLMKQFNYPSYIAMLGGQHCCSTGDEGLDDSFQVDQDKIIAVLNNIRSTTAKQDFIVQIRRHTYNVMAKKLECQYVFLSDIGVSLAKTLLLNVALGRGRSVALDVAFCDDREEIKIIRPMRDINPDEIRNYIAFSEKPLQILDTEVPFKEKASLQNLTSKFVDDLQKTFPSTVSTVFRTGDKLAVPQNLAANTSDSEIEDVLRLFDKTLKVGEVTITPLRCKLCHAELDFHNSDTLFATEFSRTVSSRINVNLSHEEILESTRSMELDATKAVTGELDQEDRVGPLKKELCHSCRNIFLELT